MSIDTGTVEKIARLARIRVSEEEKVKFAGELNGIMQWIEQLQDVDTEGVEPMTSVVDMSLHMREDEVTDGGMQEKILANAPEAAEGFFVVPKVVE
ncbi:MAG: Asp-tRNA(Asn)/Glu-tRNA(Gln) amidotransferase subunit GatC [Pseudomonadota bacterium]|jgi:aspartyl-tRNA(Asn)/glutamyl-tRNA(Gln) amidotransferase subunit C|nr:Asp-tRNA(Asn)/Glu-tRNA(Gln) amidotransferase subunit GatC [Pseudomonadota bacterium]QKK04783.1 MAG: Asp-tRNA(Asn)/Glu-tRNA(Gln) amidotransferase subunit GatC [Pseudomonadota bacterium]|tara:strand:- start:244 stop:531 length:288 start_codon:yes stop_codon:yes gene_type:complete